MLLCVKDRLQSDKEIVQGVFIGHGDAQKTAGSRARLCDGCMPVLSGCFDKPPLSKGHQSNCDANVGIKHKLVNVLVVSSR